MSRAGVEITPTAVRLVRVAPFTGRVSLSIEQPWDPSRPLDAVAALRAKGGSLQGISIAIGLGFLEVARVDLPPVSALERARIVELEPDRYFATATRESMVVTVLPDEPLAFGAPASLVSSWLAAFETWAPVDRIEPAPAAMARAIGRDGTYLVDAGQGETGVVQFRNGRLVAARRTRDQQAISGGSPAPVFTAARGAVTARSDAGNPLAPDEWRRRSQTRRHITTVLASVAAAAAVVFAIWSADRWRERTLTALDQRIVELETQSAAADTALRKLRSREAEASVLRELGTTRADPLLALAAISAALPREATVLSARASGNDWQIDGTTQDASVLVPLLDRHARFDSVRFLTASSRYRDGSRSYETFSIALRVRAP